MITVLLNPAISDTVVFSIISYKELISCVCAADLLQIHYADTLPGYTTASGDINQLTTWYKHVSM